MSCCVPIKSRKAICGFATNDAGIVPTTGYPVAVPSGGIIPLSEVYTNGIQFTNNEFIVQTPGTYDVSFEVIATNPPGFNATNAPLIPGATFSVGYNGIALPHSSFYADFATQYTPTGAGRGLGTSDAVVIGNALVKANSSDTISILSNSSQTQYLGVGPNSATPVVYANTFAVNASTDSVTIPSTLLGIGSTILLFIETSGDSGTALPTITDTMGVTFTPLITSGFAANPTGSPAFTPTLFMFMSTPAPAQASGTITVTFGSSNFIITTEVVELLAPHGAITVSSGTIGMIPTQPNDSINRTLNALNLMKAVTYNSLRTSTLASGIGTGAMNPMFINVSGSNIIGNVGIANGGGLPNYSTNYLPPGVYDFNMTVPGETNGATWAAMAINIATFSPVINTPENATLTVIYLGL